MPILPGIGSGGSGWRPPQSGWDRLVQSLRNAVTTVVNTATQHVIRNNPDLFPNQTSGGSGTSSGGSSSSGGHSPSDASAWAAQQRAAEQQRELDRQRAEQARQAELARRELQRDVGYDLRNVEYDFFGDSLPVNRTALMQYTFAESDWDESWVRTSWTWTGEIMRRTGVASVEQGLSPLTTERLTQNIGDFFGEMTPRDQALYILQVLIPDDDFAASATAGRLRGRTSQEALNLVIDSIYAEQYELANDFRATGAVTRNGRNQEDLREMREGWQQLEGSFGVADDMTLDVLQWAADNFTGLIDMDNARDVEAATRNYLYQELRTLGVDVSGEAWQEKTVSELLASYNTELQLYIDEQEAALQAPFQADLDTAYAAYLDELNDSPVYQLPITKEEFAEYGTWQSSRTPDLRHVYPSLERIQQLNNALNNNYESPPDTNLLLMLGTIFIEPLDWIVTGIEIIQDLKEGDITGALGNGILLAMPLVSGFTDDVLSFGYRSIDDTAGAARGLGNLLDNSRTLPILEPDLTRLPRGVLGSTNSIDPDEILDIALENRSAVILSQAGYDVIQTPFKFDDSLKVNYPYQGNSNPDYLINGRFFDGYAPRLDTHVDDIWEVVRVKSNVQASRVVINMSRNATSPTDLEETLATLEEFFELYKDTNTPNLQEVIVIYNDTVIPLWNRN